MSRNEKNIERIKRILQPILSKRDIVELLKESKEIVIRDEADRFYLLIPDIVGYLQGSGRTSRLYGGGLSKGISLILVDEPNLFESLKRKLVWYGHDSQFKNIDEVDLEEIISQVDKDREYIKGLQRGDRKLKAEDRFKTTAIIVESPNKASTIAGFFGKPFRRKLKGMEAFEVLTEDGYLIIAATKGHLCDLNKEIYYYGVEYNKDGFIPYFEPIDDSRLDIVSSIRRLAQEVSQVIIATDPDTEGEKIGYDAFLFIRPYNNNILRAEFHEVTKGEFLNAIRRPRQFDTSLVRSQLLRRIADRWIGFVVSHYLQRLFNNPHLSAGRVQSPVLEWIVKRDEELKKKVNIVRVWINGADFEFPFEDKAEALEFYKKVKYLFITKEEIKEVPIYVYPFTTDTMISKAAKSFGFSPQKVMKLAQDLFEAGFITYHRTDSIRVSQTGMYIAKEFIKSNFGEDYVKNRSFSESGGAHESIRPTKVLSPEDLRSTIYTRNLKNITEDHIRLYSLIFKNFIASQMKEAKVEKVTYVIRSMGAELKKELTTKIIERGNSLILPIKIYKIPEGKVFITKKQYYTRSTKSPYTFSTIIEEMKARGIGRPSTYAITIEKLLDRGYIVEREGKLYPTRLGKSVVSYLKQEKRFYELVKEEFTKILEETMDGIEQGQKDYQKELSALFNKLKDSMIYQDR